MGLLAAAEDDPGTFIEKLSEVHATHASSFLCGPFSKDEGAVAHPMHLDFKVKKFNREAVVNSLGRKFLHSLSGAAILAAAVAASASPAHAAPEATCTLNISTYNFLANMEVSCAPVDPSIQLKSYSVWGDDKWYDDSLVVSGQPSVFEIVSPWKMRESHIPQQRFNEDIGYLGCDDKDEVYVDAVLKRPDGTTFKVKTNTIIREFCA